MASDNPCKCIIIGPAYPLRGGIANFNEALAVAMNAQGIDTTIFSFSLQYPNFLFPGKSQLDTTAKSPDVKIETVINSINPLNWLTVANHIKEEEPSLVIVRYWLPFMAPCLGTIIRLIKRSKTIKVIAITDNVIPHEKRIGDKALTAYFVKQCHGFITMSKSVLNDLSEFTNTNKKVFLPHPVYDIFGAKIAKSQAREYLKLSLNKPYILFFGLIRKYKGLDILLEAMADKRLKQLDVKLIVAGEYYEDAAYYEDIINKHNLQNSIILNTHFISANDVKYYFCAADIVVQPYRTATQSGVTQIAYHFERPMLVTNVGGLSEIVKHNHVGYVTPVNANAIATALIDFYEKKREVEFTQNTAVEKQKFQWSAFVQGVVRLYKSL